MSTEEPVARLGEGRAEVLRRAVADRTLRRALSAYAVFNVAEWANWVALLVWAYNRDGVGGASAISIAQLVPAALLAPSCAALAARLPRAWALSVGYGVQAITFTATAAALALHAPFAVVAAAASCGSVAITLTRPTHFALLPQLSRTTQDVTAATTASGLVTGIAAFVGPALSGALLATGGPAWVLLATGAGSAVSGWVTARLVPTAPTTTRRAAGVPRPSMRGALREPGVRPLTVLVGADAVLLGLLDILLVVLALDLLGMNDAGPGVLSSALGVGSVVGGAATVVLVGRARLTPAILAGAAVAGAGMAGTGLVTTPLLAFALIGVCGAGRNFLEVTAGTLLQRSVAEHQLSAAYGLQESLKMAGTALGALIASLLVTGLGPRGAFGAAGLVLPALAVMCWPRLRRLDQRAAVPGPAYALLAGIPLFAVLSQRVIERLARDLQPVTAAAGTPVIVEGESGDAFYVVGSGQLQVTDTRGQILRTLGPGDWFGEIALLRDVPRTSTVTAVSDVTLQVLSRGPFLSAVTGTPIAMHAAHEHAARYRDLSADPD